MNFNYIRAIQKFLKVTPKEAIRYAKKYRAIVEEEMKCNVNAEKPQNSI
jgi:hypothetical protein